MVNPYPYRPPIPGSAMPAPGIPSYAPPRVPWSANPVVTALGTSLLATGRLSDAGSILGQTLPGAMQAKTAMQTAMEKRQEEARRKAAMSAWLKNQSRIPLSPDEQALVAAYPELGETLFKSAFTPTKPERPMSVAGQIYDPNTGTFTKPPAGQVRTLVTPEERAQYGIPPEDKKPYQVDAGGALKAIGTGGVNVTVGGESLTPGRRKVDEDFAADFVEWERGGFSDTQKQVRQLEEALKTLEGGKNLTGPDIGLQPYPLLAITNPEAIAVRETVEEVVQRNLRLVLGAQFTEKEGERLIARSFNPLLSEQENAKRLRRLILQIKSAAIAKQAANDYFREHGTLAGWNGKMPTIDDFNPDVGDTSAPTGPAGPAPVYTSPSGVKVYTE